VNEKVGLILGSVLWVLFLLIAWRGKRTVLDPVPSPVQKDEEKKAQEQAAHAESERVEKTREIVDEHAKTVDGQVKELEHNVVIVEDTDKLNQYLKDVGKSIRSQ